MVGRLKGVQAVIQQGYPAAAYTHCASHCLNPALCDSCTLPATRNAVGTVRKVCAFYAFRKTVLKTLIAQRHTGRTKKWFQAFCETRWVEQHDAIQTFVEYLPAVIAALEDLQEEGNTETATKAHLLMCGLTFSFLLSIMI